MSDDLEDRLRARASRDDDRPALSEAARLATRAELAVLVARETRRRRTGWVVAAAAALLLVLFVPRGGEAPPTWSAVEAEVALLDGFGRPLDARMRSTEEPRPRPAQLLVEVVAPAGTHVLIGIYDPRGALVEEHRARTGPEGDLGHGVNLAPLPALDAGPSWVSVVVVTTDAAHELALPARHLPGDRSRDAALAAQLGAAATVQSFVLSE